MNPKIAHASESADQLPTLNIRDGAEENPQNPTGDLDHKNHPVETPGGSLGSMSEEILVQRKSKGVREMETLLGRMTPTLLAIIYGSFMLLSYTLSLNQYTASYFLNIAVSESFHKHSLQASVTTIAAVFQAMAQPPIAKLADAFGRVRAEIICVVLYVLGNIIIAAAPDIVVYAVGDCIYQLGITGLFLLQNIIIADISSLRNRYIWTIFPSVPQVINAFVSANIVDSLLKSGPATTQWRWGFAIYTILIPVISLPLILTLWRSVRAPKTTGDAEKSTKHHSKGRHLKASITQYFWQLDLIGLLLFVIGFGLFFVTITLANSQTARWSDAHSIAQLVLGFVVILAFIAWERWFAPHPLLPFALLRRKTVIGCCLIALWHSMAGRIAAGYLTTFLQVAAGQSVISTQRITSFPSVAGWVCAIIGAWFARRYRMLKPVIIAGAAIETLAIGLMIRYRTSTNTQAELAIVQIIRGAANGLIPYPVQALIQAASPHEQMGAVTAGWLVVYYISGGIGSAVGGAMWTNIVPKKLDAYLGGNQTLTTMAYGNPFGYAKIYPIGSPERNGIAKAQDEAQRAMVITGTVIAFVGLLTAIFLLDNLRLTDEQSLEESEAIVEGAESRQSKLKVRIPGLSMEK